jgi:hypothetical protein
MVDSGVCLTITGYAAFSPEAKIVVSQGGELVIDGGHLTKACPQLWRGIILAENSVFRNNETDILFAPFKNEWNGNELPYAGSFEKCQFITTDALYELTKPKAHVEIKDIYEVRFLGCIFKNESDIYYFPHTVRGTGISGIDAQFMLGKYCNTPQTVPCISLDTCKFIGLEYGIKALNSHSIRTLNIQDLKFENNLLGISISGINNLSILSNTITCPPNITGISPERFTGGLFLEGCNDYHIEDNYIYGKLDTGIVSSTPSCYGMGVKNSGPRNNEIYNNSFFKLKVGIYSIGENRDRDTLGLCLKCNDMYFNLNDFIVVAEENPPLGSHQGINKYQGNPNDSISDNAPAGNIFSYFSSPADHETLHNYNYLNAGEDLWYVHHRRQLNPLTHPLDSNYTPETIQLKEWVDLQYEKDSACPSGIYGGGLKIYYDPRLTIYEADNHISDLISLMNQPIHSQNWPKIYSGNFHSLIRELEETYDQGYIITGYIQLPYGFSRYIYLIKTDINGNILWNKKFGDSIHKYYASNAEITIDNGLIISGATTKYSSGDFDPVFIKTDVYGEIEWCRVLKCPDVNYGTDVI